ncbi:hypothetical protein [Streptomyces sp. NPDC005969]|uniref:hypothetical protein n=1 Tax=Streptomyces sp. NPDC005969 TaxID=3156722 RepID=UPI0033EA7B45
MTFRVTPQQYKALRARLGTSAPRPAAARAAPAAVEQQLADDGWDLAEEIGEARNW